MASSIPPIAVDGVGQFFFEPSHQYQPDWVSSFCGASLGVNARIFSASARGVLLVPIRREGSTLYFAISFGIGRHLLNEGGRADMLRKTPAAVRFLSLEPLLGPI